MSCDSFISWITSSSEHSHTPCTTTFNGTLFCGHIPELKLQFLEEVIVVGCFGVIVYACVFSFGLFTFLQHRVAAKKVKIFYLCIMISAFLEIVMQAGLIMCAAPSNISFACHIMSEQMLLVSFSMVVLWWSITICRQRKCLVTTLLVVLVLIQSAGAVLVIIYDVAFERKNFAGFLKTVEFKLQAVSLWTCMALLAVSMLVAALISTIWCRIPQSDDAEDQAQQQAAKRFRCCLSVTTLICAFCFLMRVVMGICAEHFGRADNSWIDAAMWYILCYWIPTAVPSVCMLILWRPNSNATRKQESAPIYGRDRSTDMSPPTDTRRNTRDYYPLGGGV